MGSQERESFRICLQQNWEFAMDRFAMMVGLLCAIPPLPYQSRINRGGQNWLAALDDFRNFLIREVA